MARGGSPRARARLRRNSRGELTVYATASPASGRLRRARRIPDDDEELGAEAVRQLNARFALGDLSFFAEAEAPSQRRRRRGPLFGEVADAWLEGVTQPEIEEST